MILAVKTHWTIVSIMECPLYSCVFFPTNFKENTDANTKLGDKQFSNDEKKNLILKTEADFLC